MLNKKAFANSLAVVVGLVYILTYVLAMVAPSAFEFLFNAQFFGAELAPEDPQMNLWMFVSMVIVSWVIGYAWAWLYNKFSK